MKYKKISSIFLAVASLVILSGSVAYADPATTKVTCNDGKKVTAKKDAAPPTNLLDEKDYKKACRGHGGYTKPSTPSEPTPGSTGSSCGGVDTAIIKCDQDNSGGSVKNNAVWGLLIMVINILSAGVGILAVGGIVYASILYTTAEDKQDQVNKSKDIITNVVIGLVAYALMWSALNFLIPGGLFN